MIGIKSFAIIGSLVAGIAAQAQFGAPENSAAVLAAFQAADASTLASQQAATAFVANNDAATRELTFQNYVLRSDYQFIGFTAQQSPGFYTEAGAQAIIDFINNKLYPDTRDSDVIYSNKRDLFVQTGFITFINAGLIQLRQSVAQSAADVIAKTPASKLTAMTVALFSIEIDYAFTQELQQFGKYPVGSCQIPAGLCGAPGTNFPTSSGGGSQPTSPAQPTYGAPAPAKTTTAAPKQTQPSYNNGNNGGNNYGNQYGGNFGGLNWGINWGGKGGKSYRA